LSCKLTQETWLMWDLKRNPSCDEGVNTEHSGYLLIS